MHIPCVYTLFPQNIGGPSIVAVPPSPQPWQGSLLEQTQPERVRGFVKATSLN